MEDWGKLIGDVPAATAILDRFLHHAEMIQITGKSYRLRNRAADKQTDGKAGVKDETAPQSEAVGEPKPAIPPTGSSDSKRTKTATKKRG